MRLTNTKQGYGWVSIALHWLLAIAIMALFGLGVWMVDLDYYSPWYHDAPNLHKSIGVCVVGLMLIRFFWLMLNPRVGTVAGHPQRIVFVARIVHRLFYLLVILLGVSGYFISTAEGQPIEVFGLFAVPAYPLNIEKQADQAGDIHFWLAVSLIGLSILHAAAAVKHHVFDKDATLKRMLKPNE